MFIYRYKYFMNFRFDNKQLSLLLDFDPWAP